MDLEKTFPLQTIRGIRCVALLFLLAARAIDYSTQATAA